mgnify:FL=1
MTYSPKIPQGNQTPAGTQAFIQTNFSQYAAKFLVNHTAINSNKQGDHEAIVFEKQLVDPGVTEDLVALYCKDAISASSTQPQLFFQILKFLPKFRDYTDAPNTPMQLTFDQVNTAGPVYQSFMAGAYLLYFGMTINIAVHIDLIPTPSVILSVIANPNNLAAGIPFDVGVTVTAANSFKINSTTAVGVYTFTWMAIALA